MIISSQANLSKIHPHVEKIKESEVRVKDRWQD